MCWIARGVTLGKSDCSVPRNFGLAFPPLPTWRDTIALMGSSPDFEGDDPEAVEPVKAEAAGQVQAKSEAGDKEAHGSPKEVKEKVGSPPA